MLTIPIDYTLSNTFRLQPRDEDMTSLCLSLAKLRYDLIASLTLSTHPTFLISKLDAKKAKRLYANRGGYLLKMSDGWELRLKETEVENWLRYYLSYHQEGIGRVNHIDLQYPLGQDRNAELDMTVILYVPRAHIGPSKPRE